MPRPEPIIIEVNGERLTAEQWGARIGMTGKAIRMRLKYMTPEQAVTTPKLSHVVGLERGEYRCGRLHEQQSRGTNDQP